ITIGPEPIRQIESRSGRLGNRDLLDPTGQERPGIVGAWARLGMELEGARAKLRQVEPLDGAVVERDVRRFPRVARSDGEPVILAGDEHASAAAIEHGVVYSPVPELELEGAVPGREREQLMAEADPEDRHLP